MKIKKLTLFSAQVEKQAFFYSKVLSLPKIGQKEDSVSFMIGDSVLKFSYRPEVKPYHFAFNICSNKAEDAMQWLSKRVELLSYEGKKIVNFRSWDAEAIYFYDSDGNIVEFIARHRLNQNSYSGNFSASDLLSISEIGVPTLSIQSIYNFLYKNFQQPIYDGTLQRFAAIGDEEGLFIIVNQNKKWMPTNDPAQLIDFEGIFEFNNQEIIHLHCEQGILTQI